MENIDAFFKACEEGKGWPECKQYCAEDATFHCDVLPMKTLSEYTDWMKGLVDGIMPNAKYHLYSVTHGPDHSIYCAQFEGTHSLPGGPIAPSDPPKSTKSDYVYMIWFNGEHKVVKMHKIWDQLTAFKQLGWPIQ